jgi:hypothetical protein
MRKRLKKESNVICPLTVLEAAEGTVDVVFGGNLRLAIIGELFLSIMMMVSQKGRNLRVMMARAQVGENVGWILWAWVAM